MQEQTRSLGAGGRLGRRRILLAAHLLGVVILCAFLLVAPIPPTSDADNFWMIDLGNLYRDRWGGPDAFVYAPVVAQIIDPLTVLPFDLFYKAWQAGNLAILAWLVTPAGAAAALLLPFVQTELSTGNIHFAIALVCALGLRFPAAWSFALLTKVTAGVGVLWFLARREWGKLAVVFSVTAAVTLASAIVAPRLWADWIGLVTASSTQTVQNFTIGHMSVIYRLPIGAGLLVMAAWRNRPAAIPPIVVFCLPAMWLGSPVILLGIPRLLQSRDG